MPRVKHYFEPGHFYHIATRTEGGVHAFASDDAKRILVDALDFYRRRGRWRLHAFVVMANHVHLVASETGVGLSLTVRDFKKWTWRQLTRGLPETRLWERRFDDNAIIHPGELVTVIQYIHNNPVRIGLVRRPEDYVWSSAPNYAGLVPVAIEIDRITS
jgi:REP element-mobilizing transposase RayT